MRTGEEIGIGIGLAVQIRIACRVDLNCRADIIVPIAAPTHVRRVDERGAAWVHLRDKGVAFRRGPAAIASINWLKRIDDGEGWPATQGLFLNRSCEICIAG